MTSPKGLDDVTGGVASSQKGVGVTLSLDRGGSARVSDVTDRIHGRVCDVTVRIHGLVSGTASRIGEEANQIGTLIFVRCGLVWVDWRRGSTRRGLAWRDGDVYESGTEPDQPPPPPREWMKPEFQGALGVNEGCREYLQNLKRPSRLVQREYGELDQDTVRYMRWFAVH